MDVVFIFVGGGRVGVGGGREVVRASVGRAVEEVRPAMSMVSPNRRNRRRRRLHAKYHIVLVLLILPILVFPYMLVSRVMVSVMRRKGNGPDVEEPEYHGQRGPDGEEEEKVGGVAWEDEVCDCGEEEGGEAEAGDDQACYCRSLHHTRQLGYIISGMQRMEMFQNINSTDRAVGKALRSGVHRARQSSVPADASEEATHHQRTKCHHRQARRSVPRPW